MSVDLSGSTDSNESQGLRKARKAATPLPKVQLSAVFFIQLAEPITATVIYPFIPEFIRNTGITQGDEKRTGYYAGIVESIFFIAECLSVYHWARASDYFGRRPVLLLGPLGLAAAMFGFGFSTKYWSLVFFRCAQGVFNGNIGVGKTVIAESTDPTNIVDALSTIPLMWSVGVTLGPLIGGLLANPAITWPSSFGKIGLLRAYPYLLPCTAAGLLCIFCFTYSFLFLEETASSHKKAKVLTPIPVEAAVPDYGATATVSSPVVEGRALSFLELLKNSRVAITMTCYGFLSFGEMAYSALAPLVYSSSIGRGGLGFDPHIIGTIMGTVAVAGAFTQILFFSRLLKRFGHRNMFITALFGMFIAIATYPCSTFFAKRAGKVTPLVMVFLAIQLLASLFSYMAYTAMQVLCVDSTPNKASLAATNGLGQVIACFMRSLSPFVASSLFSVSLEHNLLGGYMVYVIILGIMATAIRVSFYLPRRLQMVE